MKEALKRFWWLFGGVIVFSIIYWLILRNHVVSVSDRGQFGDAFGALNTFFTGLAFAAFIAALILQRESIDKQSEDIKLQKDELTLTRNVLEKQREQFENQSNTLKKQTFENTFFQLLRLHNEIVDATTITTSTLNTRKMSSSSETTSGRDCFSIFYNQFKRYYSHELETNPDTGSIDGINNSYLDFYTEYQAKIGHYFRNLYNIIKFIKNSDIEEKKFYTNLIRAHLSSAELLLLFYNCLSEMGNEKFKPLIQEFELLKHLPGELLLNPIDHMPLYDESAYGKKS